MLSLPPRLNSTTTSPQPQAYDHEPTTASPRPQWESATIFARMPMPRAGRGPHTRLGSGLPAACTTAALCSSGDLASAAMPVKRVVNWRGWQKAASHPRAHRKRPFWGPVGLGGDAEL